MKKKYFWSVLLIICFLSCGAPFYYEKAEINKGFSFGGGVGVGTGTGVSGGSDWVPFMDYYAGGLGTLFFRYSFSNNIALFLQSSAGVGWWLTNTHPFYRNDENGLILNAQLGIKWRVNNKGAMKLGIGVPDLLDCVYLHDVNDFVTLNGAVKLRFYELAPSVGFTLHPKISNRILGHLSFNIIGSIVPYPSEIPFPLAASLGFGIEGITPFQISRNLGISLLQIPAGIIGALALPLLIQGEDTKYIIPFIPLSATTCAYLAGQPFYKNEHGSFCWTTAGAYAGVLTMASIHLLTKEEDWLIFGVPTASALGAVLGYQLSRPHNNKSNSMNFYFEFPKISFRPERLTDGKQSIAVDIQLINCRF